MRRRPERLELSLDDREFQALKRIRRLPVDYRDAPLIFEEVVVREIVDRLGRTEVVVNLRVRVDETLDDVELVVRRTLARS